MIALRPADVADLDVVRGLFNEYAAGLGVDLCFQGFERELAELPGDYAPPHGRLLLAWDADDAAGCAAGWRRRSSPRRAPWATRG